MAARDTAGLLYFHLARAWNLSWDGVLLGALALSAALLSRRAALIAMALPLLSAAPALLVWSQRRHVLVLVPVALAVIAASAPARRWSSALRLGGIGVIGLLCARSWAAAWPLVGPALATEVPRARAFADVAGWISTHGPPGSLLGGVFQDVGLYAHLPRHDPDGSAADWRTYVVSDRPLANDRWSSVYAGPGGMHIYQLDPDVSPRPCAEARPAPATPFLAIAAAHAALEGADEACERAPGASLDRTR